MQTANSIGSQIAVIGAGISGIACARVLSEAGLSVHVFDKGRRPGGRVSSRTVEKDGHDFSFDYGAQYFTVRHPLFRSVTAKLADKGMVVPWPVAGEDAWVGTPRMATLIEGLADGIDIAWGAEVTALSSGKSGWSVRIGESDLRNFDQVVLAMPAEQTALLAGAGDPELARRAAGSRTEPCWTVMLGFAEPLPIHEDIVKGPGISSATRNSGKPKRQGGEAWVVHADPEWSRQHLEHDPEDVEQRLSERFASLIGVTLQPIFIRAHRWRYALSSSSSEGCYWNEALGLGACGDWLLAPRIESAWISGHTLGKRIVGAGLDL